MSRESTRRITAGIGATLKGLGWLLAAASGLIGLLVFMSGPYGYVIAIYTCLPVCLVGLGAVALGHWLSQLSEGSNVEKGQS